MVNGMKNITLSVDEHLLKAAHKYAASENTTLNIKFRQWLEDYIERQRRADDEIMFIEEMRRKYPPRDRKFTRDEMNER